MAKYAEYITQIEIDSLWSGRKHVVWNLDRHVNILSGINGEGKSTILNKVVKSLSQGGEFPSHLLKGVHLKVEPEDARWIRYDLMRSFDMPVLDADTIAQIDSRISSALDFQLYNLQRKYLDYQVNIGNRLITILQSGEPDAAKNISFRRARSRCLPSSSPYLWRTTSPPCFSWTNPRCRCTSSGRNNSSTSSSNSIPMCRSSLPPTLLP